MESEIGLIGLGVMGQNLALNMANHGYKVAIYNRTSKITDEFLAGAAKGNERIEGQYSLARLVDSLKTPKRVMLMVKAGDAVDVVIRHLTGFLGKGDIIIDGGNSFFKDSQRRYLELEEKGILFMGTGISGGEEGALIGPSIMPGGSRRAWEVVGKLLTDISAKAPDGTPCCAYLGPGGAGHFTKMVHNGIEYVDMQLIAESYHIMRDLFHMEAGAIAGVFEGWNSGGLDSYLIGITAEILRKRDDKTGKPLVDMIKDSAAQKGTGLWTAQEALALGTPAPSLAEAVFARNISAHHEDRSEAAKVLSGPMAISLAGDFVNKFPDVLGKALLAAKICAYSQGFALLFDASKKYGWKLDLGGIALLWRGGCIIRAKFLDDIKNAYDCNPALRSLMMDAKFASLINEGQNSWRQVVSIAALSGVPIPAFTYRSTSLPANLIQAQRDYFGAHTYERTDMEGAFHTDWA
jgi:6-phosphogluconate dehydrogenase